LKRYLKYLNRGKFADICFFSNNGYEVKLLIKNFELKNSKLILAVEEEELITSVCALWRLKL